MPMNPPAAPGFGRLPELLLKLKEAFALGRPATWTDRYKFLMAEAGFPLRTEEFVYSCRRGGPYFNTMNLDFFIPSLRPRSLTDEEFKFLGVDKLHMSQGFCDAMQRSITTHTIPPNSWFHNREPAFTVRGPSALVSNMEGSIIGETTFRINVATLGAKLRLGLISSAELAERLGVVTCEQEADIIQEILGTMGISLPVTVDTLGYYNHVYERCTAILDTVDGDATRVSEGGLRSATCPQNHLIAVAAAQAAGWKATSNVFLAMLLGMKPVGTTGHEHTQRHGSDLAAYEAAVDRCPGNITMLLDTFSTLQSGRPTAIRVMEQRPDRTLSVRPDCESTMEGDFMAILSAFTQRGLVNAGVGLSGGFNVEKTRRFEEIRTFLGWPSEKVKYLYGEFTLKPHVPLPTRSMASAVFKVCETAGRATMKFSDGADGKPGPKSSKPGRPVIFRLRHPGGAAYTQHPMGIIGQHGEAPPDGYFVLSGHDFQGSVSIDIYDHFNLFPSLDSPQTAALVAACTTDRETVIRSALEAT